MTGQVATPGKEKVTTTPSLINEWQGLFKMQYLRPHNNAKYYNCKERALPVMTKLTLVKNNNHKYGSM
jgi:hypothetical protein